MMNRVSSIIAAAALCSCAAHPAMPSHPFAVPDDRILSRRWLQPDTYTSRVDIDRGPGSAPASCGSEVSIDAVATAILHPGERLHLYLRPGDHLLATRAVAVPTSSTPCFGELADAVIQVESARPASYRIFTDASGDMHITQGPFQP